MGHQSNYVKVIKQSDDNKLHYDIVNNAANLKGLNDINLNVKINRLLHYSEGTQDGYHCMAAEEE